MADFVSMKDIIDKNFPAGTDLRKTVEAMTERVMAQEPWDEPTYRCLTCVDTGYVISEGRNRVGYEQTYAAPCPDCDAGQAIRAGRWFAAIYPVQSDGKRGFVKREEDAFKAECLRDGTRGMMLKDRVESLRQSYQGRSRKSQEAGDE